MSWAAVNYLLRSGHSWSGRERNNCFVNMGDGVFADVSYLSGIGFIDDALGVGSIDWDGDGDLDAWLNNRTSPRVRLMRNNYDGPSRFVAMRLIGRTGNRDAVGARVTLRLDDGRVLMKTVRAGVNYTIQGTKELHFGLGPDAAIEHAEIRWPGGAVTEAAGLEPGGRYLVDQGEPAPRRMADAHVAPRLEASTFDVPPRSRAAAVPLGVPLPMPPDLVLEDFEGTTHRVRDLAPRPVLINIWASWCAGCRAEFADFREHRDEIDASGVRILAYSVDTPEDRDKAIVAAEQQGFWFPAGMADPSMMHLVDILKNVVFDQYEDLPLPTSFLLDREGRLARIYLGPCEAEQLVADVRALDAVETDVDRLHLASASPGGYWFRPELWLVSQAGNQLIRMTRFLAQDGRVDLSAFYAETLVAYVEEQQPPAGPVMKSQKAVVMSAAGLLQTDPRRAESLYREALKMRPDSVSARVGLAAALLESGGAAAVSEARAIFEDVLPEMREPTTPSDYATYGVTFYRLGDPDQAVAYLEAALADDAENPYVRMYLGSALIETGNEDGISHLRTAMETLPSSHVLEWRLARGLDLIGRPEEAITHYERCLAMSPPAETVEDHALIGQASFRVGRWEQAIEHLQIVTDADPERTRDRSFLGLALAYAHRDAEARPHLEATIPDLPPEAGYLYLFGIVRARTGDLALAAECFEEVLRLDPEHVDARLSLARAYHRLGDLKKAVEHFEAYIRIVPADLQTRERLAFIYQQVGRVEEAVAIYRDILAQTPAANSVKFALAWLLAAGAEAELRDCDEAKRLTREVIEVAGRESPYVLDLVAAVHAECGEFAEAVDIAREAISAAADRDLEALVPQIESRLELYLSGKPYRIE